MLSKTVTICTFFGKDKNKEDGERGGRDKGRNRA
jgi:hypothetical protein